MGERHWGADTPIRMVPFSRQGIARRVTDDAMYLLAASHWWRWQPKEVLETLARDYEFGPRFAAWPVRAGFTRLDLAAETVWVPVTFKPDMQAADGDLRSGVAHARQSS